MIPYQWKAPRGSLFLITSNLGMEETKLKATDNSEDLKKDHRDKIRKVYDEVAKVIVGQKALVNRLMVGLFTQSHILLEGVVHGGVIGHIISQASGAKPFAFNGCDNGSISKIVVTDGMIVVRGFNDVTHLDGHLSTGAMPT